MLNDTSIRDWIAVILTFGVLSVVVVGQFNHAVTVPDRLWDIYFTVIGFFFATTPSVKNKPEPTAEVKPNVV